LHRRAATMRSRNWRVAGKRRGEAPVLLRCRREHPAAAHRRPRAWLH
jgi:hypothetical protein